MSAFSLLKFTFTFAPPFFFDSHIFYQFDCLSALHRNECVNIFSPLFGGIFFAKKPGTGQDEQKYRAKR